MVGVAKEAIMKYSFKPSLVYQFMNKKMKGLFYLFVSLILRGKDFSADEVTD